MNPDQLVDPGNYPEIIADGIADVHFIGPNVSVYYFRWRRIEGIFRPCLNGCLTRAACTFDPEVLAMWRMRYALPIVLEAARAVVH